MRMTRAELCGLLLGRQGLLVEQGSGGVAGAANWVRTHGFLMLETAARALAPGHDLVLYNRLPGYQAGDLDMALYDGGQLIEHYLHVLGALPAADYALLCDPPRAAAAARGGSAGALVLACLTAEGPCTLRDLQAHLRDTQAGGARAVAQAVYELHASGAILVRRREGSGALYDLAVRVLPGCAAQVLPAEERLHGLAYRTLHVLAPVTRATWSQVLGSLGSRTGLGVSALKREKGRVIAELLARGEAEQVEVQDGAQPYFVPAAWLAAMERSAYKPAPRLSFLSPIDPIVWDGRRALDLFGFDVRRQAYLPTIRERRLAPPALAILYGQVLVGRLQAQMNWGEERFTVRGIHLEGQARLEERHFRTAFADAVRSLAAWHGAREIRAAGPVPPRLLP
ncbi:MAG TPA: crosslink repair DNA glycosylase YcaQ family protein [Anaerolineae bacterium]|nr:crosslink repair DNA glycosylase YcaQ family protein [Anaerolineae bacterium]HOQ99530.1 crosslink repair DNA glycosylase YcaQ family protein [Anaerolineae bacterium]HPL29840.1 crosslink repair DNA glycosylase YcaQ family protein [Anaerolineae bacterium]